MCPSAGSAFDQAVLASSNAMPGQSDVVGCDGSGSIYTASPPLSPPPPLTAFLSICVSVCVSVCLCVCLCVCLSVLSVCLSVCLFFSFVFLLYVC